MFHLVYTSHAAVPFPESNLIDLLKQSRKHNRLLDITGMLLYLDGKFIQVLEGSRTSVLEVYEKIKKDPRHLRVVTLIEGNSKERVLNNWSMGFKKTSYDEFTQITGFKDIDVFFEKQRSDDKAHLLLVFLQLFYKQNITDYSELPNLP